MIRSMTGFGSASFKVEAADFQLEVRSVNHRHIDARVRLPRVLASLEAEVRSRITGRFGRGKFDCTVTAAPEAADQARVEIDLEAARSYLRAARALEAEEGTVAGVRVAELLTLPGVATTREPEFGEEIMRASVLQGLDGALDALEAMRASEGAALERDLGERLAHVSALADELDARAAGVQEVVRERLRRRARQLEAETGILDEARLHQEVVLHAERLDVTEEIVRLRSHVDQFRKTIAEAGPGHPVGRRLDFLLQELSREANTVGSKGSDAPIAHLVVDLKTELERIREQVQNVE